MNIPATRPSGPICAGWTACLLLLPLAGPCWSTGEAAAIPGNLLPNAGFEEGTNSPAGWHVSGGAGFWSAEARGGRRAITVEGNGRDTGVWRTGQLGFVPGGCYQMRFAAKGDRTAGGGLIVSGVSRVNRDFHAAAAWQEHAFYFRFPDDVTNDFARLGQWERKGRLSFDDAELRPVLVAHARIPGLPPGGADADGWELGEAESVRDGVYWFAPDFGWAGANVHRPLFRNRAAFNSDRWIFGPDAEVVYRLGPRGTAQRSATVRVALNHYTAGSLVVEAGRDAASWTTLAVLGATNRSGLFPVPAVLFPADELFVRLRSRGSGVNLQVNTFEYGAPLAAAAPELDGQTHFLAVQGRDGALAVQFVGAPWTGAAGLAVQCILSNTTAQLLDVRASAWLGGEDGRYPGGAAAVRLFPHGVKPVVLPVPLATPGLQTIHVRMNASDDRVLFAGELEMELPLLLDPRPGYWLAGTGNVDVWWCESGWKIGRDRGPPARETAAPIRVAAARGEDEPVQIVLRPARDGELRGASLGPLRHETGEGARVTARFEEVAFVRITRPTDATGRQGWYPDPLPPLRLPLALRTGQNQPLWMTVRVPRDAPAGVHRGEVVLETSLGSLRLPFEVQVSDFALPRETHLASGFGLGTHEINRYHRLRKPADQRAVYESYLRNFAAHRISPYSFFDYDPIEVRFAGEGTNRRAEVDFTRFDAAAARWLDEEGFCSFRLPLRGMGGGTFHSRSLGQLEGFAEGTPEHARLFADYLGQVERHLRARGWLAKAYTYWFDEPDRKDYEFVVAGQQRIRAAAPGLRRLLTEQPEPELLGHVEIWCGLTPEWTPETVQARRVAGDSVWWYICTAPKAPYVTEFIDHPGTELRLWPWQSWQYGVDGILVWATVYWNSSAAFPAPRRQDPWTDPMSYVSGYDFKPGQIGYWGNGDGRFLYPPRHSTEAGDEPLFDEPVNSIRWENLRDGMEDYEYFWLLQQAIARAETNRAPGAVLAEARALLRVPSEVSRDLTHFTTDPRLILRHRQQVAGMIERLLH